MKILSSYLLTRLLKGYGVMLVAVGAMVWVTTLLEELGGSSGGVSLLQSVIVALLQIPVNLIDLLPVITVLATATVFSSMQAQSEITVMRASGVSLLSMIRLALLPGLGVAISALVALQFLAPVLYQSPERIAGGGVGENSLWHPWHGLWVRSETEFMNVGNFELGQLPGSITIFEFNPDGSLRRQIRADQAIPNPERWILEGVTIKSVDRNESGRIEHHDRFVWTSFLSERQLELFRQPPASLRLSDLWAYVQSLKRRDQDASEFELVLWQRIALPLACLGMVLIASALAAQPSKNRAVSVKVSLAIGIGLGYQLLAGMAGFFGLVADISPVMVALAPPFALAMLSLWLLRLSR
ncbi:MAG: LPS export ABC transporter permease LptG [Wenzhouxiangellaceae bacterium]|nr:LPS export ABC transporter permease LptG [Wenzhouxiangellaceae bacterium]